MKSIVLVLVIITTSSFAQTSDVQNAFDFGIVVWYVSVKTHDSTTVKGSNKVTRILDGKVIQENFVDPIRDFKGTSISAYNPADSSWHQAWADNQGGFYAFIGEVKKDVKIFKMEDYDHKGAKYRMVFSEITDDSFIWEWQGIRQGWDEWKTVWKINYRRVNP